MHNIPILPRTYDLVIYGATGFTGQQCLQYIANHAPQGLRWSFAGRDKHRLKSLGEEHQRPWLYAEANDLESIDKMCANTRVILSTAGPFTLYSDAVVEACITHKTHYVDITGETPWIKSLIDRFHQQAVDQKTVILPACGFDSVPSDLGVWWLAQREETLRNVDVSYTLRGGFNGGTIASALTLAESGSGRLISKRTLLCPEDHHLPEQPRDPHRVKWDFDRRRWLIPFFMGPVNTRIVRRSAALLGYGPEFKYQEWMQMTSGVKARVTLGALGLFNSGLKSKFGRQMIKLIAPKPGRGPDPARIESGFVRAHFIHRQDDQVLSEFTLSIQGDPGNKVTCESVCEAALALVANEQAPRGGVLTPSFALGQKLWDRLEKKGWSISHQYGSVEGSSL